MFQNQILYQTASSHEGISGLHKPTAEKNHQKKIHCHSPEPWLFGKIVSLRFRSEHKTKHKHIRKEQPETSVCFTRKHDNQRKMKLKTQTSHSISLIPRQIVSPLSSNIKPKLLFVSIEKFSPKKKKKTGTKLKKKMMNRRNQNRDFRQREKERSHLSRRVLPKAH